MRADAASIAVRRFGLGPRPGEIARIAADPKGFVLAQLSNPRAALLEGPQLRGSPLIFSESQNAQFEQALLRAMQKREEGQPAPNTPPTALPMVPTPPTSGQPAAPGQPTAVPKVTGNRARDFLLEDAFARFDRMVQTDTPLLERLVAFWSNHFAVSALKGGVVRGMVGAYEREAIRPHVLGRFGDMLKAVEQHPVMLFYLDNQLSVGPTSPAGRNRARGLNENLAREILELHTLGVDGGYTQSDVTNLARIITGWAVTGQGGLGGMGQGQGAQDQMPAGVYIFAPNRHEPGKWPVLGKMYGEKGRLGGEEALADLARHPSTAKHVATKLARHFISEAPQPKLVSELAMVFQRTDGDLAAVTKALATSDEAWATPPRKVAPPTDFAVGLVRGLGLKTRPGELLRMSSALGQPLWQVQSPKGWTDEDNAWMGPAAVRERLRIAEKVAREVDKKLDPREAANDLFGTGLSEPSRLAIARAETREQGFEMLVMTPEFQRR